MYENPTKSVPEQSCAHCSAQVKETTVPLTYSFRLTMMTMTHSEKIPNISQKPGPTDMSDGVMTP